MAISAILQLKKDSYLIKSSEKFKIKRSKDRKKHLHKFQGTISLVRQNLMRKSPQLITAKKQLSQFVVDIMEGIVVQVGDSGALGS